MSNSGSGRAAPDGPVRSSAAPRGASSSRARRRRTGGPRVAPGSGPSSGSGRTRTAAPTRRRPCAPYAARDRHRNRRRRDATARGAPRSPVSRATFRPAIPPGGASSRRASPPPAGQMPQGGRRLVVGLVVLLGVGIGARRREERASHPAGIRRCSRPRRTGSAAAALPSPRDPPATAHCADPCHPAPASPRRRPAANRPERAGGRTAAAGR